MGAERAEVRWVRVDAIADGDWPRLLALLDDAERQRADRFAFPRDRQAYVAAHVLGRSLLSDWAGGAPGAWGFVQTGHGKPEVRLVPGMPRLRLNLSHTRGLAAAALTVDNDIGVDVEWLGRRADCLALARRFFAHPEHDLLQAVPAECLTETFLALWTLKEAYVKAIGKGLAQPLDSFSFTLRPPVIAFAASAADDPARWLFRQERPTPDHVLALAIRHDAPQRLSVVLRESQAL